MKGTLERELRLRAEAGFRLPTLPGQPLRTRRFSSTYHDTPDHRLAALGVTLRFRARNGDQRPKLLHALGLDPAKAPRVRASSSPRALLVAMLLAQHRAIVLHDPGTRLGSDPEELHRHRVAVRRLRALLRAARPMLDAEWVDGLRAELGWLGAVLGEVRDLDVLLASLEQEAAGLTPGDQTAFAPLLAALATRREAARALMLAELRQQ